MKIALFNIRSIRNKLGHISESLTEFGIDILCLTETWLLESDTSVVTAALPDCYSMLHVPRSGGGSRGGGVAVIYRKSFSTVQLVPQHWNSFEIMEIKMTVNSQTIRLAVVYRPGHPGTDMSFLAEFATFLENFSLKQGKLLICGDFNYWLDNPSAKPYSPEFLELIDQNNFCNLVDSPTHISGHTLDLVMSPVDSEYVGDLEVIPIDPCISDHALIVFSIEHHKPPSYKKLITFIKYNIDENEIIREVQDSLISLDVATHTAADLVQTHHDFFKSFKTRMCQEVSKWITVKEDSLWYDSSVAQLRRRRRYFERRWRRLRSDQSRREYTEARAAVVSQINKCKVQHFKSRIDHCAGDQKKLFSVFDDLLGLRHTKILPTYASGTELATSFSQFFASKIARIRGDLDRLPVIYEYSVNFQGHIQATQFLRRFESVTADDVRKYIRLSNKTFCLLDPINVAKVTTAYEASAAFIAKIINACFNESNFVSSEKLALLNPLLKKVGLDCEILANYRPVSNLSFLSKLIERAALDQLVSFIDTNNIVPSLQSAYRKHHSVESALCRIHNDLVLSVCEGKPCLLVLLDLSAAFDTIDHELLLADLYAVGVREEALSFLRSYLLNRFQRVNIDGAMSEAVPLQYGVPQGSLLGPVLFTIYTCSLASLLIAHGVKYHFYADDTQFYIQIEDVGEVEEKMVALISDIRKWMSDRKLKLNDDKTEMIIVHGPNRSFLADSFGTIVVDGCDLAPSASVRNLGIIFDGCLNFKQHISMLVKSCNYHMRNIYAIRKFLDRDSVVTLIHSFVLSKVDYCNSVYNHLPRYLLKKLQSIINRAARVVFSLPPRTPTTPYLIELHWLPVTARIEFKLCLLVYKALKFGEPKYLIELLTPQDRDLGMSLRSDSDPHRLREPRAVGERSFADRSFSYTAPRLYNRLPPEMKQLETVDSFKKHLKTYLFTRAYHVGDGHISDEYSV